MTQGKRGNCGRARLQAMVALAGLLLTPTSPSGAAEPAPFVPSFFDLKSRLERPDLSSIRAVRFLTDDDYPPFHFVGPDGQLSGFNVELARLICEELKLACTIQARRWDTLLPALDQKQGDAVIASIAITPALRQRVEFSIPYYKTPARFAGAAALKTLDVSPTSLAGRRIGVVAGSAHQEYLRLFFPAALRVAYAEPDAMRLALKRGEVELVFADAVGLAFWLNGSEAAGCCGFVGGPYTESYFFGEGVGIAVARDAPRLKKAIDYALTKIARDGAYTTLYLKYFPIGFY